MQAVCRPTPGQPARRPVFRAILTLLWMALGAIPLMAQAEHGGEANLDLPDLNMPNVTFLGGMHGRSLLMFGLIFCVLGMIFGLVIYMRLKNMAVHKSMLEISELIYETCKTYLRHAGQVSDDARVLHRRHHRVLLRLPAALGCHTRSLDHSAVQRHRHRGSYRRGVVRHPREHVRQLPDRLRQPARQSHIPATTFRLQAGMSIGMLLISGRADHDAVHPAVHPARLWPGPASSASPSANRWAPRRCAWRAASSPRSPISAPT